MKFSFMLKKKISNIIFLSFLFNVISTFAFATAPHNPSHMAPAAQKSAAVMPATEANLNRLIHEIVQKALASDYSTQPTPALMRCYERIVQGQKTLLTGDVMQAMPELLNYAIAQYESKVTRASRPQNPYEPGAVVGSILVNPNASCSVEQDIDSCDIINLLLIIKKQIGTVEDDVCCDSVLGVLGDACEILGMSISEFLLTLSFNCTTSCQEICCDEIIETITECCALTTSNFIVTWSLIEECCQATQSAIEECCLLTESLLVEILDTLTQCCDDLADDIFDLEEIVIECCEQTQSNFEITWSLIENLNFTCSLVVDLEPVLDAIDDVQNTLTTCCADNQTNFETTWSLIDNLNFTCSLVADLAPVLDAIDDVQNTLTTCCADNQANFETTWSLINDLNFTCSLEIDLAPVLDAIDDVQNTLTICCADNQTNFETTWSLINNLNFTCSLVADLEPVLDAIDNVQNTLTACCADNKTNFETTWSLINNLNFTCSLVADLDPILDAIDDVQNTLTACCADNQSNFETTWSLINALDASSQECCLETQSIVEACCVQTQSNFGVTWSRLDDIEDILQNTCNKSTVITTPTIISTSGSYCLGSNISGDITIAASNVNFDLNGFTIVPAGTGITVTGAQNVAIFNGNITGVGANITGISIPSTGFNHSIQNINFDTFLGTSVCMSIVNQNGIIIDNCRAVFANSVLNFNGCINSRISNVTADSGVISGSPFLINGSRNITVDNCLITRYRAFGGAVSINNSINVKWANCQVCNNPNTSVGLKVSGSSCIFQNSEFCYNGDPVQVSPAYGLWLTNATACVVENCVIVSNNSPNATENAGILLDTCNNCSIVDSMITDHNATAGSVGVIVRNGTASKIARNTVLRNSNGFNISGTANGFVQNYADNNATTTVTNYNGIANPIVKYDLTTGDFTPFPYGSYANISVEPALIP